MKQKNKVITDINVFTIKELFVHLACTVFVIYFNLFLSEILFLSSGNKVLRVVSSLLSCTIQMGILSTQKLKAFCMQYCNDDRMRVVIKSNQTF